MPKIWMLPSVSLNDRALLPNKPGIYYAVNWHGQVLYVGRADNLYLRWNSRRFGAHHKLNELSQYHGVKLHFWKRPLWRLRHDEAVEIDRYDPPENSRKERQVWWIAALDFMVDSVHVAIALLVIYTVWRLRS